MDDVDRQDQRVLGWVGGVPDRWEVHSLGSQLVANKSSNKGLIESRVLSLSYGRVIVKPLEKLRGLVPESFETYQIVEPGDIVIRPTDLQNDQTSLRVGQSMHRGIITSAYICLRPTDSLNHRYAFYLLAAYDFMKVFYGFGSGLRQNLDVKHIKHIPVAVPSLEEQQLIVRFLDHAELRIARAIATKQKMVSLMDEQRGAVVAYEMLGGETNRAAVKQLEGFGEIPNHWEVVTLRGLLKKIAARNPGGHQLLSVLRSRGVIERSLDRADNHNFIPDDLSNYKVVKPGDLVMNKMKAWSGSVGVSQHHGVVSPAYFVYEFRSSIDPSFMNLLFRSNYMRYWFGRYSEGVRVGQWDLSPEEIKNIRVPVPSLEEQIAIAERVVARTAEMDTAIASVQAEISLLKEYRTRLISDVVTGKLDVRKEAAKLPVIDPIDLVNAAVGENGDDEEASDDD
jgi:type I restriction enzyme S subunit